MQTRPQQKLDEEEIARQLEKLTPEERAELERVKAQWESLQREREKNILEHIRTYPWSDAERQVLRECGTRVGLAVGLGAVSFATVGDLWLRKVRGVTRPLPRALFFIPSTLVGAMTGLGFTSGYCIERLSLLSTPLGATMRDMLRARAVYQTHPQKGNGPAGPGGPPTAPGATVPSWQSERKEGDLPIQKA